MNSNFDKYKKVFNVDAPNTFEELVSHFFENDSISIPLLAKKMSISVSTLERLVKSKYNMTPKQFIIEYKLTKAANLLSDGNLNIKQVAAETRFNSVAYFCHCFKKKFGITPNAFSDFMKKK